MLTTKPKNPFMYYSGFKLALYYKNNPHKCQPVHSIETKTTLPQIIYKKVKIITLDRQFGYQWCIEKAIDLQNYLRVAFLFNAYDPEIRYGKFFENKWHMEQDAVFNDENRLIQSNLFTIRNGFVVFADVEANDLAVTINR